VADLLQGNEVAWERAQEGIENFSLFESRKGKGGKVADIALTLKMFVRSIFCKNCD
jgi:hypothetical protein